jgi:hypothetical protein
VTEAARCEDTQLAYQRWDAVLQSRSDIRLQTKDRYAPIRPLRRYRRQRYDLGLDTRRRFLQVSFMQIRTAR